ncbi:MAG: T9SS type A sorting domain-containing protein [Bacteroidota bacterium]
MASSIFPYPRFLWWVVLTWFGASPAAGQVQIGSDIKGEVWDEHAGSTVALSSDGRRVAIGSLPSDGSAASSSVRVYQLHLGTWVQLGSDITREASYNYWGGSTVAVSSDGDRVAIGAISKGDTVRPVSSVRIYEYADNAWVQLGSDIDGEEDFDESGRSVALSSDGCRVAIGATHNSGTGELAGHVRVFEYADNAWVQLGLDIDGEAAYNYFGASVALSSDGRRVAIGAHGNDGTASNAGHARVYEFRSGTWVQLGTDIDGEAILDRSGWSVALSSDGSRVAIGAGLNSDAGLHAGHVRVFEYVDNAWVQLGTDIDGEAPGDGSGSSVALSADGRRLAIGAAGNAAFGWLAGHVRIFEYNGGDWAQLGTDIDGKGMHEHAGHSVSLSADGLRVAFGAPRADFDGILGAGYTRIFDLGDASIELAGTETPSAIILSAVYPNPLTNEAVFTLALAIGQPVEVSLFDALGRRVRRLHQGTLPAGQAHAFRIERGSLPAGVYLVRVAGLRFSESRRVVVR